MGETSSSSAVRPKLCKNGLHWIPADNTWMGSDGTRCRPCWLAAKRRRSRRWNAANPQKRRDVWKRHTASGKRKAANDRYEKTEKGAARTARYLVGRGLYGLQPAAVKAAIEDAKKEPPEGGS